MRPQFAFLADEDFDNRIVRGLWRRYPDLDIIRVQSTMLSSAQDPIVLEWAANENRVLLTHDVSTMTFHAYERVRQNKTMPGVVEVPQLMPIGQAIDEIILLAFCVSQAEMQGRVIFLPL